MKVQQMLKRRLTIKLPFIARQSKLFRGKSLSATKEVTWLPVKWEFYQLIADQAVMITFAGKAADRCLFAQLC